MGAATRKSPKMILGKKINPYLGLLIVFLLWFVFASPYFLHHLVPFPTRQLVAFFEPWNQYDKYAGPVKNNAMPDVVTQIYPWKHFTITELKKGHVPLWNPFNFSGNPALANFQTAIFSPFNLFYFLLPFIDAWSIVILLQPLLAGFFVYLLSRELKISTWGAAVSGVTFMFCGFMVVWMAYGTLALAIAFLPLALFAIERYWRTRSQRYSLLLALSIAISIFSGHFQTSLYLLITVIAYVLYKFMLTKDHKTMFILYLSICLGVVISLIQIIPTIVFYTQSFRSNSTIVDGGIPLYYLITSFAPDFFGNPVTRNDWVGFYAERASFVGIIPLYLAGLSLFERKKRDIIFFAGLALVALLFAVASPLQSLLALSHIPVISSSNPTRIIVLCSFALSVLSGFGLDYLCESLSL
ncbi:MAG TPA: YfhO family protein, partial [Patescibacteria group bacterium]|nr:YfhO family protein [Patescibacteria group bacterium]